MKTIAIGLAALLMSTSVYAQSAATGGTERGGMGAGAEHSARSGGERGAQARGGDAMGSERGGARGDMAKDATRDDATRDTARDSASRGEANRGETNRGETNRGDMARSERGSDRSMGARAGRDTAERGERRDEIRSERSARGVDRIHDRTHVSSRTDVRSTTVDGGYRREGRYVFIGGRRVVYGSPEYRRLIVTERRSTGPRRYVTIRGQRVIYGSPEYRRLVSIGEQRRYVTR